MAFDGFNLYIYLRHKDRRHDDDDADRWQAVLEGMILATYLRLKSNHIVKCCLLDIIEVL